MLNIEDYTENGVVSAETVSRRSFFKNLLGGVTALTLSTSLLEKTTAIASELKKAEGNEEAYWKLVQEQFMLEPGLIFMNNGSLGAMPRIVFESVVKNMIHQESDPVRYYSWGLDEVRQKAATLLGVSPSEIVLTRCTTEGMNIIAQGLPLKRGDEVLSSNHEHPGGMGPWQYMAVKKGIQLRQLEIPNPPKSKDQLVDLFASAITKKTKVISVSHIMYSTGLVFPVKELCQMAHSKGVLVALDGAHVPGMLHVNLKDIGCDFFASSSHKWLLAPKTTGILYVKDEVQEMVEPLITNLSSDIDPKTGKMPYNAHNVSKLEGSWTFDIPIRVGMGTAIDFQNMIGFDRVEARCRALSEYLREKVIEIPGIQIYNSMDRELSAALTSLSVKNVPNDKLQKELNDRYHIEVKLTGDNPSWLNPTWKLNSIRISTHIYNSFDQVAKLLDALKEISKASG